MRDDRRNLSDELGDVRERIGRSEDALAVLGIDATADLWFHTDGVEKRHVATSEDSEIWVMTDPKNGLDYRLDLTEFMPAYLGRESPAHITGDCAGSPECPDCVRKGW